MATAVLCCSVKTRVRLLRACSQYFYCPVPAGRFIPIFSTVGVAFSDARKSMRRLDASGFLAPFTTGRRELSAGMRKEFAQVVRHEETVLFGLLNLREWVRGIGM